MVTNKYSRMDIERLLFEHAVLKSNLATIRKVLRKKGIKVS